MSKTRKLLSVITAVAMLLSVLAVSVFAGIGYSDDTDNTHTQVWTLSTPVDNEDGTYSVDVSLTTTYATGAIEFLIENTDTAVAELSDAELGDAVYYDANISYSATTGKVMIVPVTSGKTFLPGEAIDGVIATLTFAYAGSGSATINIAEDPKATVNVGGTLIAAYAENLLDGSVKVGQVATFADNSQVIGAAAEAPTLAVIDGTIGVIDTNYTEYMDESGYSFEVNGYIYGVEVEDGETIDSVFEVVGDGYMQIIENEFGCDYGTGAMVYVCDNNSEIVEKYIFVLFGDVNGDGAVDSFDASLLEAHDAYAYDEDDGQITDTAVLLAGDIDASGSADAFDASGIEAHDAYGFDEEDGRMQQADVLALM